jgi:hypothetical protein
MRDATGIFLKEILTKRLGLKIPQPVYNAAAVRVFAES